MVKTNQSQSLWGEVSVTGTVPRSQGRNLGRVSGAGGGIIAPPLLPREPERVGESGSPSCSGIKSYGFIFSRPVMLCDLWSDSRSAVPTSGSEVSFELPSRGEILPAGWREPGFKAAEPAAPECVTKASTCCASPPSSLWPPPH